ncbi:BCL2 modifying factor 2 [Oryzias melastigma]|uniref:BCL2 modifying factor 2 n=1 Tax=Oryzias melastigma TaxID=30732 RepID=UPI00168CD1CD|nr:BCL2 modifying factor 2 [Oryzias melastigma]
MDDEEDDMSRPVSQLWGTPFRDVKFQERAIQITGGGDFPLQEHATDVPSCSFRWQPRRPFHGNAGLRSHFPAQFEPMEDRGPRPTGEEEEEEEEEDRGRQNEALAERPEEQPEVSVEVQIGRKLREIGDQFNQDHMEVFMRHRRQNVPLWMRLTAALFGLLFPRGAPPPRLRGALR